MTMFTGGNPAISIFSSWRRETDETVTFKVGHTYSTRSIGDHNMIISITIEKRTKHFVTTSDGKRFKVKIWNNTETVKPWGSYSMTPMINANHSFLTRRLLGQIE